MYSFQKAIESVCETFKIINYLEIGSALGASLSLTALMLRKKKVLGKLVSIDPYYKEGYIEGSKGIWKKNRKIDINENAMQIARALYKKLMLEVELIRVDSREGLKAPNKYRYHLIYIDGSQEGLKTLIDFALCTQLIEWGESNYVG